MRRVLFFAFLLLVLGCLKKDRVIVEGKLLNANDVTLYLYRLEVSGEKIIDSLELKENGKFRFKLFYKNPEFLTLHVSKNDFITLQVHPEEKVSITGDANDLVNTYRVLGSEGSLKVKALNNHLLNTRYKMDSIADLYKKVQEKEGPQEMLERLNNEYTEVIDSQRRFSIGFILDNLSSFSSILALYQQLDTSLLVLYKVRDLQFFHLVSDSLKKKYPRSSHVRTLLANVKEFKSNYNKLKLDVKISESAVVKEIPDIALPNIEGDTIRLFSLKGKYVLLSFWASWSDRSVQNNLKLLDVYEKYYDKGFEIYQVSLDNSREAWIREVRFSALPWINVSDLKYPDSPVPGMYNVNTIPANYLIDRNREIIGKNLSVQQLHTKLMSELN